MATKRFWESCWVAAAICVLMASSAEAQKTITFVGAKLDATDYSDAGLDLGNAGFWFPQFDAPRQAIGRPTDDNDRNSLPSWAPINFTTNFLDPTRTFSLDNGGVKSEGGDLTWNTLTLPDGETGLSGSIVDPQTVNNSNNTINKIVFQPGVPESFLLHIVVDNTNGEHDPVNRLRARGEGPTTSDVSVTLNLGAAAFNGIADVYTFRYDGWETDDFIKLQLNGAAAPATGAGFGGLMFDVVPEPASVALVIVGAMGTISAGLRRNRFRQRNS